MKLFEIFDNSKVLVLPSSLSFNDLKDEVNSEINRQSYESDLQVELVKKIPENTGHTDNLNHAIQAMKNFVTHGKAKAYRLASPDRRWVVVVDKKDVK